MDERDAGSIEDMLEYARRALRGVEGKSRADLDEDEFLNLGLQRLVEIIGEAAARVSEEERRRDPQIPWGDIIGMRNRLIHGYDVVDTDILWRTLQDDLPVPAAALAALLSETTSGSG